MRISSWIPVLLVFGLLLSLGCNSSDPKVKPLTEEQKKEEKKKVDDEMKKLTEKKK